MNFTAIDFETAHANFPCEIGLSRVENGQIVASHSWLIKPACFPYMNPWNERVHGISSSKLVNAKPFDELWTELKPLIEDQIIVAHNASFDTRVLRASLTYYELALPRLDYFCSVNLSKKVWTHLDHHTLDSVCHYHGIRFHHHRAGDDAEACARICLLAFGEVGASTVDEGLTKLGVKLNPFLKS